VVKKFILKNFIFVNLFLVINAKDDQELALDYFMQGQFLLNQGNYAMAVIEFQDAILLDPNAITIHISLADAYRRIGKVERALDHLQIALDINPDDLEAMQMLGKLYISENRIDEAENVFLKLSKLEPENLDHLYVLADISKVKRKWSDAIDYYLNIYDQNPDITGVLQQALQLSLTINDLSRSDEICELMLKSDPMNLDILGTLKDIAIYNKNYQKALDTILKIEKENPSSNKDYFQKSLLHEQLNQPDLALKTMYVAYENDSLNVNILQRIVTLSIDQDLRENALYYNEKIIQKFPNDSKGYVNKAVMSLGENQPTEAIQNLIDISNKFLDNFMVQYLLGTAYYQVKDYINSEKFLYNALTIYPESRNTKHNLALIHDIKKEWEKSDEIYLDLISTDSLDAQALNNYAYSLVERNVNIDLALELSKSAIKISPKSAPYLDTIGWIYFKMNKYDKALDYIKASLNIDENNPTIREHFEQIIKAKAELEYSEKQRAKKD